MNFEYSLTPINLNVTLLVCGVHYCAGTFFLWLFLLKIHLMLEGGPKFLAFSHIPMECILKSIY